ncbi:hypothetical protein FG386_003082 [Cryptosporidium ryanae]|uniref:uncharacterized protein n=1 Tax=Cryptosporidium ryanae TaxID=515981 RepID=UPI003519FAE1|nr:hypothetical protein FG386_003082 [Cryptosporidium ryanae]
MSKKNPFINRNLCSLTARLRDSRTSIISCVFIIDYESDISSKDNESSKNLNLNGILGLSDSDNDNLSTDKCDNADVFNCGVGKLSLNTNYNNISLMVLHKNGYIRIYLCQDSPNFIIWSIIEQFSSDITKNVTSFSYINNVKLINSRVYNAYLIALGAENGGITVLGKFKQVNGDCEDNFNYDFDCYYNNKLDDAFDGVVDNGKIAEFNLSKQKSDFAFCCSNWEKLYSTEEEEEEEEEEYDRLGVLRENFGSKKTKKPQDGVNNSHTSLKSDFDSMVDPNYDYKLSTKSAVNLRHTDNSRNEDKQRGFDDNLNGKNCLGSDFLNNDNLVYTKNSIICDGEHNFGRNHGQNDDKINYRCRISDENMLKNGSYSLILNCVLDLSWSPNYCREYDILVSSFDVHNYNKNGHSCLSDADTGKNKTSINLLLDKVNGLPWIGVWKWTIPQNSNILYESNTNIKEKYTRTYSESFNLSHDCDLNSHKSENKCKLVLMYCILNSDVCDPVMSVIWDIKGTEFVACSKRDLTRYVQKYNSFDGSYASINPENYFFHLGDSLTNENKHEKLELECFDNNYHYILNFPIFAKCINTI